MTQRQLSYPITASMSCDARIPPEAASSIGSPAVLSRWLAPAIVQAHEDAPTIGPDGEDGDRPGGRR